MKSRNLAIIAAMSMAFCAPASANSLTFQGVTFQTFAVDADTLQLTIDSVLSGGTGNWSNAAWLGALEIKGIGTVTSATLDSWTGINLTGWGSNVANGLSGSAVGCANGGTPGACFTGTPGPGPAVMSDLMTFTMSFVGSGLSFDAPHLKVQFLQNSSDTKTKSNLLSQNITTAIPEPEIYAMMGLGLGLIGWVGRRRRLRAA